MLEEFIAYMDVNFLVADSMTSEKHREALKRCLKYFQSEKQNYQLLWSSVMLGRNVFDEMVEAGAAYMKQCIMDHPGISPLQERKRGLVWISAHQ